MGRKSFLRLFTIHCFSPSIINFKEGKQAPKALSNLLICLVEVDLPAACKLQVMQQ